MGFIGKVVKGIGKGLGSIAKGVMKFAQSPFGKLLINVGLGLLTGGTSSLLTSGLGMLAKGGLGSMLGSFGGFASKFLGTAQSFLSGSGLGSIGGFLKNATGSGDLLKMATDIFSSRQSKPATDSTTNQIIQNNLAQLFAQRQAQTINWAA
jgi:hypothetical protein